MKYYAIAFALLVAGSAHAQINTRGDAQIKAEMKAPRAEFRLESTSNADVQMNNVRPDNSRANKSNERVRALTDIKTDARKILDSQFNPAQQFRLENAGEHQEKRDQKKEAVREFIKENRSDWKENRVELKGQRKERVKNNTQGIITKLTNGVTRLEKADIRIQTFINAETSVEAIDAFNKAHELLEGAVASVEVVKTELSNEIESAEGTSSQAIRKITSQALSELRGAWTAYQEVIIMTKIELNKEN